MDEGTETAEPDAVAPADEESTPEVDSEATVPGDAEDAAEGDADEADSAAAPSSGATIPRLALPRIDLARLRAGLAALVARIVPTRSAPASPEASAPEEAEGDAPTAPDDAERSDTDAEPEFTDMLVVRGLRKMYDDTIAVDGIDLDVPRGSFYGIVGPNGAGKTTTLSMITGLLRPDEGRVIVNGADVWADPIAAKRTIGVLPDRLRLFDRLTGAQLLHYAGTLRGIPRAEVHRRVADLARVFGLEDALGRLVSDYSAGMTKQIALAAALIHSPRLLVLDEPFESVDPVSAERVTEILRTYVAEGGTVVLSSHSMELVERICDRVAVVVGGVVLAEGTIEEVSDGRTLEERFVELVDIGQAEGLEWLQNF